MNGSDGKNGGAARKGQSLIEYIVLVAAVLGFLMVFLRPGGTFSRQLTNVVDQQGNDMMNVATTIFR